MAREVRAGASRANPAVRAGARARAEARARARAEAVGAVLAGRVAQRPSRRLKRREAKPTVLDWCSLALRQVAEHCAAF